MLLDFYFFAQMGSFLGLLLLAVAAINGFLDKYTSGY